MTERDALIAAICANPADDTPRLVFADWCGENGDPERLEFIRLQCELHALIGERGVDHVSLVLKRNRETALLARNRERWSRWPCPECGIRGFSFPEEVGTGLYRMEMCVLCHGKGDLFHDFPLHFRRGFPFAVEVPDMGRVCRDIHDNLNDAPPPEWEPTPWLRAVARHTTIEEVWVMDREPNQQISQATRSKACCGNEAWEWWREGNLPAPLFNVMWEMYPDNQDLVTIDGKCLEFPSPDAARSALGQAWIEWGRKEEVRG